jgi:hypothetical protein
MVIVDRDRIIDSQLLYLPAHVGSVFSKGTRGVDADDHESLIRYLWAQART